MKFASYESYIQGLRFGWIRYDVSPSPHRDISPLRCTCLLFGAKFRNIMGSLCSKQSATLEECQPHGCRIGRLFLPNRDKLLLRSNNLMKHPGVNDFEGVGAVLPKHQKECLDGWFPFKWYYCLGPVPKGLAKSKHVLVPFQSVSNI